MQVVLLGLIGMAAGVIIAGGAGAILTTVGILTRLAFHSHTQNRVRHYENCVVFGVVIGTLLFIYMPDLHLSGNGSLMADVLTGSIGCFMGIFVGCLAMALSEALDVSAIFFRRLKIQNYLWMIMLAAAIGKFVGNIIYFWN